MPTFPSDLPIAQKREEIAAAIAGHQVVIVCGETGSGKSTQLPKIALAMGRGTRGWIGQTQPRRIAARSIAARIAQELDTPLGQAVGYKIRFADKVSQQTSVKIMTDGILLAETQRDATLQQYDTLIIDEAHERSLNIDFLLGYLKQLLPRRGDLKLIVTSATIDPQRFSKFFDDAPVIEVSGRMFPVEVRYRPPGQIDAETDATEAQDLNAAAAVAQAVRELDDTGQPRGDILVFLPGEREIRETAEALASTRNAQILPLYARLPPEQQMRIFDAPPAGMRRIVLATNVAETSLTVPGIRYVIDTGLARMSRYSPRHKVQRLPIEPVSQASAQQRAGRCGRVADGVCIRLYSEDDFAARPAFTQPEILRTNLASVILQMKALRLGEVEDFPFIEPPARRLIRDGHETLVELGAIDTRDELTPIGRQLAKLPIDPRLGRMILAARREQSLAEVLIITAALAAGDARLRPVGHEEAAQRAQAMFRHGESDFLGYLRLWEWLRQQSAQLSQNKLRKACAERFLSLVRLREWQDIHRQLVEMLRQMGMRQEPEDQPPASYAAIHRALLTGLLSSVGQRTDTGEYEGPRGVRFWLFPGSGLFAAKPRWVMAAELVETTKLYARSVAKISPHWIERLAAHLTQRTYADPHWHQKSGDVEGFESVLLQGLPVVHRRRISFGPIDAKVAREIFIYEALVEGRYDTPAPFARHNAATIDDAQKLAAKLRKGDLLAGKDRHYAFYESRLPRHIYNARRFEHWLHQAAKSKPDVLRMTRADVLRYDPAIDDARLFPDALPVAGMTLPLEYRIEPRDVDDGVNVTVPLAALPALRPEPFDWLVPGLLPQKIEALLRRLPKDLRVLLIPIPQTARTAALAIARHDSDTSDHQPKPPNKPLTTALAEYLHEAHGLLVSPELWHHDTLPQHLRMTYHVTDDTGHEIAVGDDLPALQVKLARRAAETSAHVSDQRYDRQGITTWDFGDLPETVPVTFAGMSLDQFPAIVDADQSVSLQLVASRPAAHRLSRAGLRRLFMLHIDDELADARRDIPDIQQLLLLYAPLGSPQALKEQIVMAAVDRLFLDGPPGGDVVRTAMEFELRRRAGRGRLRESLTFISQQTLAILHGFHQVTLALPERPPSAWTASLADVRDQLASLMPPDFLLALPPDWRPHLPRYLSGIRHRLTKLATGHVARDAQLTAELAPHVAFYRQRRQSLTQHDDPRPLETFGRLLQELRISVFAQHLGTATPISFQKLEAQRKQVVPFIG